MRTALNFIAAVPLAQVIIWANSGHANPTMLLVIYGGYFIWAAVATHLCTLLDWSASAYCSIWIVLTTESAYELWRVLIWTAQTLGMRHLPLHSTPMLLGQLGFTIACCVTVRYTMARTMPEDGIYHIGPRQLGSAGLLGVIFVFQFFALQTSLRVGLQPSAVVAPSMLTQFYCVTLLYLQTELFKKAAMQKEMDALNLLYDRQRKQYQIARQNVQIINRKCHELKVQIADLRRLHFGEWTLDTASRELIHASQATTPLGVSGYALLLAFLEHPYETLSREHLSRVLKREYMPYDRIIDVHVSQIPRTLGKQADGSSFIKTLRSQGYVFVADVEAGR